MATVILPNELTDRIHLQLDKELAGRPISKEEKQSLFNVVLDYFDKHGVIPSFRLKENEYIN